MSELDRIFAQINRPSLARKTTPKRSPAQIIADLQKSLDILADSQGVRRVELPVVNSIAATRNRKSMVRLDPITKRDTAGSDPLGSENLGTRTARQTGGVRKAERTIDLYGGFVSKSRIEGND